MKPIERMHNFFGSGHPSNKCGDCNNLVKRGYYYKCSVYGESSSEATDWRKKWNSCAMFNMPYNGILIKDVVRYLPRIIEEEQIEGQMTIFDLIRSDDA